MSEVWKQMIETWNQVLVLGILPIGLAVSVLLPAFLIKVFKWEVESPLEEIIGKKKNYRAKSIYVKYDYITEVILWLCVTLAGTPFLIILNARFEKYIYGMLDNIEVMSSIVIGLSAIVATMAVVVIVFDKKYYIVFTIKEVLQRYRFTEWLIVVATSCIIVCISTMTLLDERIDTVFDAVRFMILEIATIYNIVGTAYIIVIIFCVMFSERRYELSMLGQLYRRFWMRRIDLMQFKEKEGWSEEAVEINVDYLMEMYIEACKHKTVKGIRKMEFGTTIGCYKRKWYVSARNKFYILMLVLLVISTLVNCLVLREESIEIIILNVIVTVLTVICTWREGKRMYLVILRLFLDTWGYYIVDDNGSEKIIPRVKMIKRAIYNYILKMNSLNAFFYIWIKYITPCQEESEKRFNQVLMWIDTQDKKDVITYFPVFTIGFFFFETGIKMEKIKSIYAELIKEKEDKLSFEKMLHGQIFYLTKNYYSEVYGYGTILNEYLRWLQE